MSFKTNPFTGPMHHVDENYFRASAGIDHKVAPDFERNMKNL
jgi:hypothetical protein